MLWFHNLNSNKAKSKDMERKEVNDTKRKEEEFRNGRQKIKMKR